MLQVKGNQPKLRAAIAAQHAADPRPPTAFCHVSERRSGYDNTWQTSFYPCLDPALMANWPGIAGFIASVKTTVRKGIITQKTHYYITSLGTQPVAKLAAGIRGHWGIENKLHRTRDVHFCQDTNRIRHPNAAANVALFNTLALNYLLQNVHSSVSYAQLFFSQNFKDKVLCQRI